MLGARLGRQLSRQQDLVDEAERPLAEPALA
jgi:hypothetical protein